MIGNNLLHGQGASLLGHGIAHSGLGEVFRNTCHVVGVHGVQGSAVVGIEAGVSGQFFSGLIVEAVTIFVVHTVSALGSLRIDQLHGIGELDGGKVGDGHIDLPDEVLGALAVTIVIG